MDDLKRHWLALPPCSCGGRFLWSFLWGLIAHCSLFLSAFREATKTSQEAPAILAERSQEVAA